MNHNPDIAFLAGLLGRPVGEQPAPTPSLAPAVRGDGGYYDTPNLLSAQIDNALEEAAAGYGSAFQAWLDSTIGRR